MKQDDVTHIKVGKVPVGIIGLKPVLEDMNVMVEKSTKTITQG